MVELLNEDCIIALELTSDNTVDALVTDPPAGISFMGKEWDSDKGGRDGWIAWMTEVMRECHRVMKPGAHGLVWAIPRTSHWTATALENAGFEIRDVVTHLFGSGFPKSMNISIAIDKQAGAIGHRGKAFVTAGAGEREDIQSTSGWEKDPGHKGVTAEAKQWNGWGTALKPASEHWILIRKPISEKTVAANVLKWGTGAINVDASRIESGKDYGRSAANSKGTVNAHNGFEGKSFKINERDGEYASPLGRFPANLVLSCSDQCTEDAHDLFECPIALMDEQAGEKEKGPSRFFYCAKASKSDKGKDNSHPTVKSTKLMQYLIRMITPPNGVVLDPFMGSGSTGVAAKSLGFEFIGIEQQQEYFEIAKIRIKNVE